MKSSAPRWLRPDVLIPSGLIAFSVLYLVEASGLNFWRSLLPAEGFMPVIIGLLLLAGSCLLLVKVLLGRKEQMSCTLPTPDSAARDISLLTIGLIGYLVLLPLLGYSFCTFMLLIGMARFMRCAWRESLALALGFTGVSYLLFATWLEVPLPSALFFG